MRKVLVYEFFVDYIGSLVLLKLLQVDRVMTFIICLPFDMRFVRFIVKYMIYVNSVDRLIVSSIGVYMRSLRNFQMLRAWGPHVCGRNVSYVERT